MNLQPAAIGIVFNEDKTKVLLVRRKDMPVWVLPGGGVDANETAENAVIREIKEETGLTVEIIRKCGEYTPINKLAAFTTVFECRISSGEPVLTEETSSIEFHSLNRFPRLFLYVHQEWLKDARQNSETVYKPLSYVTYKKFLLYCLKHPYCILRYAIARFRLKNSISKSGEN